MRYFVTFYHFTTLEGYSTGTLLTNNTKGKFVSAEFIISHLREKYTTHRIFDICIVQTVEITEIEHNRLK